MSEKSIMSEKSTSGGRKTKKKKKIPLVNVTIPSIGRVLLLKYVSRLWTKKRVESKKQLLLSERFQEWASSFLRTDPRFQIMHFFDDVSQVGAEKIESEGVRPESVHSILVPFQRASVFTVWRPTSFDAIEKMMLGLASGKGLNIKGKSAKRGKLSGYVPFVQIHDDRHKKMIGTLPKGCRIRIFYKHREACDDAVTFLEQISEEMVATVTTAKEVLSDESSTDEANEIAMQRLLWDMIDPGVHRIDEYEPTCYGLDIEERLFWESYVMRQDCTREPGTEYDSGRQSEPAFQDMNFAAIRDKKGPQPVVWQYSDPEHPMDPRNLLMAYEENGKVTPVVSDFDCFLVGTRGVTYKSPLPSDQIEMTKWCVSQTEKILDNPDLSKTWTQRWLGLLKREALKGFHPEMPRFGFGDPKSYAIMEHAVTRLQNNGAVRHGAECFNYYFPQELDDQFLVILESASGVAVHWKYVNKNELRDILSTKVDEGYTFPLNPKWVLCDHGWKDIYDKLMDSKKPNVQQSLEVWYPPESGIREQIEEIHSNHPQGFQSEKDSSIDGTEAMDLAELELRRYLALQRAKRKLRAVLLFMRFCENGNNSTSNDAWTNRWISNTKEKSSKVNKYFQQIGKQEIPSPAVIMRKTEQKVAKHVGTVTKCGHFVEDKAKETMRRTSEELEKMHNSFLKKHGNLQPKVKGSEQTAST